MGPTAGLVAALLLPDPASALTFDSRGVASPDADALSFASFEQSEPDGISCSGDCSWLSVDGADELALAGQRYVRVDAQRDPFELDIDVPESDGSYRFRAWVRHARVWARGIVEYPAGRDTDATYLFPTGRVTSDGWVELESAPLSISGAEADRVFFRLEGSGVDLDGVEVVPDGTFSAPVECSGAFDTRCGTEGVCIAEQCRVGDNYVPPLPSEQHRESVARYLAARVSTFFGGRITRTEAMPGALAAMEQMEDADTAWQFWSAFARGVRSLRDWHTSASSAIQSAGGRRQLAVCFIEGEADLTTGTVPSTPGYADVLVSHAGSDNNAGLGQGDRLVSVDGRHPLEWARSLVGVAWNYHVATDAAVDAELAESMPRLIADYATRFSVIRCDATQGTCGDQVETIAVSQLASERVSAPSCDNRPAYHLKNPPENNPGDITELHRLPFFPWRDEVVDSAPGENIYGMTWDNLYGTSQGLTPSLLEAVDFFKQNARGVILDHRAGNGGTIDAPQALTQLVRQPLELSVGPLSTIPAGYAGPATLEEGISRFERFSAFSNLVYEVGSTDADTELPVALLLHRDGSASDWLPHGMKGAPKTRLFAPHPTAGAFSSFYQFGYWSRFSFQLASGDTITRDGENLIGRGVEPDEVVTHTQSALLEGRDLIYEAALAWVRSELK